MTGWSTVQTKPASDLWTKRGNTQTDETFQAVRKYLPSQSPPKAAAGAGSLLLSAFYVSFHFTPDKREFNLGLLTETENYTQQSCPSLLSTGRDVRLMWRLFQISVAQTAIARRPL